MEVSAGVIVFNERDPKNLVQPCSPMVDSQVWSVVVGVCRRKSFAGECRAKPGSFSRLCSTDYWTLPLPCPKQRLKKSTERYIRSTRDLYLSMDAGIGTLEPWNGSKSHDSAHPDLQPDSAVFPS